MPFLRITRDRHGYETTTLLHAHSPDARPRVLYVYRTAPAVRIGRRALDEEAIRTIEEQHPSVDFDWSYLIDMAGPVISEPERRPKKKRGRGPDADEMTPGGAAEAAAEDAAEEAGEPIPVMHAAEHAAIVAEQERSREAAREARTAATRQTALTLLDELVGREIAARLRRRHEELASRVAALDAATPGIEALRARVAAIDPEAWATVDEVVAGVQRADQEYEAIRRGLGSR
ncbi:MAG: hypothetical protein AB1635_03990 [Acidobacteriota bacterium]